MVDIDLFFSVGLSLDLLIVNEAVIRVQLLICVFCSPNVI